MIFLHYFLYSCLLPCHIPLFSKLTPPGSSVLSIKIYGFPRRRLLFYCLHLTNTPDHLFTHSCSLSWYFNDLKCIVSSAKDRLPPHHQFLVSLSRSLSWTFDNGLVTNLCIRNKEKALINTSHLTYISI